MPVRARGKLIHATPLFLFLLLFLFLVLDDEDDDERENTADNPTIIHAQLRLIREQMRFGICLPMSATPRLTN